MKVLVCISHVPDTTSKINFTDGDSKFDTNGVQYVINPHDEYSLTRAMWFKEKQGASITVVNVGEASSDPTLRKCLAIGADNAIRVNTPAIDSFSVAKQLAEVAKNGEYDLVIAGRESIDYNGQMVPGLMAGILDYNFVNAIVAIDVDGNNATVSREIDGGKEILSTTLPLVVAGQKGIVAESDLRIPNMRGIMMARKKPLTVVEPIAFDAKTSATSFEKPAPKSACKMIDSDNVAKLVDLLHNEAKVI